MESREVPSVSNVLNCYLREREYSDSDFYDKSKEKLEQTLGEMAAVSQVEILLHSQHCIRYGDFVFDLSSAHEQYEKFLKFVRETPEAYKADFGQLVYPIFVQLYLKLVVNRRDGDAHRFWQLHFSMFGDYPGYDLLVLELKSILTPQDMTGHKYFSFFHMNKHALKLSIDSGEYLIHHLIKLNLTIILQLLPMYFIVEERNGLASFSEKLPVDPSPSSKEASAASDMGITLENCLKDLKEKPLCLPTVYLYTLANAKNVCCANLSSNYEILVGGFEDSSIFMWHIMPQWSMKDCYSNNSHKAQNNMSQTILRGHSKPVYGMSFTPEADLLLSCSGDNTVRAWKLDTCDTAEIYTGHDQAIWDIDVSSWYFATASRDHKAYLWMLERPYPINCFIGHDADVNCIKFHPNGNYVATGSTDETVRLFNTHDGCMVRLFDGHTDSICSLAFSPNGQYVASAGEDGQIKIWDIGSSTLIKDLYCHSDIVYSLSFNDDGTLLASAGSENALRVYDVHGHGSEVEPSLRKWTNSSCEDSVQEENGSDELLSLFTRNSSHALVRFGMGNMLFAVGVES